MACAYLEDPRSQLGRQEPLRRGCLDEPVDGTPVQWCDLYSSSVRSKLGGNARWHVVEAIGLRAQDEEDTFTYEGGGVALPIEIVDRRPVIDAVVTVEGGKKPTDVRLMIDSGSARFLTLVIGSKRRLKVPADTSSRVALAASTLSSSLNDGTATSRRVPWTPSPT